MHTAYGETYDWDHVVENSLQKFAAFPNGGGGGAEDVIWESRGRNGFISSHRVLKTGTHTGFWTYGPPTGRHWVSRTVAHCLVTDNKISEEWLVRDEWAVLERLGLDPHAIAAKLAESSPVLGKDRRGRRSCERLRGRDRRRGPRGRVGPTPRPFPARDGTRSRHLRGDAERAHVQPHAALLRSEDGLQHDAHAPHPGHRGLPDRDDRLPGELPRTIGSRCATSRC